MSFALALLAAASSALSAAPKTAQQDFCKKSPEVVDGAIVIRGGDVSADSLRIGGDVGVDGYMTDLSVNCSGLASAEDSAANRAKYRAGIPNDNYGVTSAKKVCQAGGYIATTPYKGHEYHCTVWHLKPREASSLFTQY
jgi:hypothetical protein